MLYYQTISNYQLNTNFEIELKFFKFTRLKYYKDKILEMSFTINLTFNYHLY